MRIFVVILVFCSAAAVSAQPLRKASGGSWSSFPSLSADGRYTAYECSGGICRYDRMSNTANRVQASSGWALQWPKISADGEHICYMAGIRIYLLDLTSGAVDAIDEGMTCDVSADGRYVVYSRSTTSTNVYLRDRQTGSTTLISRNAQGEQGYGHNPVITPDGRYIVFESSGLLPGDSNSTGDIYLFDTVTAATERISLSTSGGATNGNSLYPSISSDGRYVVFRSWASNIVDNDNNACDDVFVRDRQTQTNELVSVSSNGVQQDANNGWNNIPTISGDGRLVAFDSGATTLVPGDTNGFTGIFLHDRIAHTTRQIDIPNSGGQADEAPFGSLHTTVVSQDGGWLAFQSQAANLVTDIEGSQSPSPAGAQIIYLADLNYVAPTPTPTPAPPDTLRPTVKAFSAAGKAGKKINLTYTVADDSGVTKETIQILKGRAVAKTIKRKLQQIPESGQRTVAFKAARTQRGKLKWCVTAADQARNKSAKSCAALRVK